MVKQIVAAAVLCLGLAGQAQADVSVQVGVPLPGGGYVQAGNRPVYPYYPPPVVVAPYYSPGVALVAPVYRPRYYAPRYYRPFYRPYYGPRYHHYYNRPCYRY
jgi:hypothetical protein